jgi:hypothetical protein
LPTGPYHPAQTSKINSLYECALPLDRNAPHRKGKDLRVGSAPRVLPLIVQGPLLVDFRRSRQALRPVFETGAITEPNRMSLHRLSLWKHARVQVAGRPDWLFVKLHCHGMDPTQKDAVVGPAVEKFLEQLVGGARERKETLHFVTAREMSNIVLAACDNKDGNPNDYRDYRFRRLRDLPVSGERSDPVPVEVKG